MNLPADAAVDGDGGDAIDALEPRRDLVLRHLAQRDRVVVAFDADLRDRELVRVELLNRRRVGVFGQPSAHAVDARAHLVGGFRQVMAPFEVELDLAVALGRLRLDADDAGHGADRLLHGTRDQLFDLQRPDTRIAGAHRERRLLELRHQIDWQPGERNEPEQRDDRADHEHRDRALNRETRNAHIKTLTMTYVKVTGTSTGRALPTNVPCLLR